VPVEQLLAGERLEIERAGCGRAEIGVRAESRLQIDSPGDNKR